MSTRKILILSIVIPPIFMFAVIYSYHNGKKKMDNPYLAKEVEYQRPESERSPANSIERNRNKKIFHEAFSK